MHAYLAILHRELVSYFASLTGYIIIGAVLFLLGLSFDHLLNSINLEPWDMPLTELFYNTYYFWFILLLASPLVTMRSFALEKSAGTLETLSTTPVSDGQIVLGKFTGALIFHMLLWLPLLGCMLIVRYYTDDKSSLNLGMVASTYLGILLIGGLFMAMGCFASSLTRSQIIASMISLVFSLALLLLSFRTLFGSPETGWLAGCLSYIALTEHMQEFVRGVIDTRYVVFYVSLTAFFLFLTHKMVESRRWR